MSLVLVVILAYADDLKVFARSYEEACRMTRFITDECALIGLTIRAAKCAVLSGENRSIPVKEGELDALILPQVTERYLGVDVDHNGINWRVYYDRVLASYKQSLRWMILLTNTWPAHSRSTVYSTFVHPQIEYGAALFALASLDTTSVEPRIIAYHDIWESLQKAYEEATC